MQVVKQGFVPLSMFEDELVELVIHFPGGHHTVTGRVTVVPSKSGNPNVWVGSCCFHSDVNVRRESIGKRFVFNTEERTYE